MEAVILVGGLGTRLSSVITELPKPLAPVANRAFIEYLFDELIRNKVTKAILATGYKADLFIKSFGNQYKDLQIEYVQEAEPLGTGGAILNALQKISGEDFITMNGDCFNSFDLDLLIKTYKEKAVELLIAATQVQDRSRYGALECQQGYLSSYNEKSKSGAGLINAGLYLMSKSIFTSADQEKFSFEIDFLPRYLRHNKVAIFELKKDTFIDIGTPEDYDRSHKLFERYQSYKDFTPC